LLPRKKREILPVPLLFLKNLLDRRKKETLQGEKKNWRNFKESSREFLYITEVVFPVGINLFEAKRVKKAPGFILLFFLFFLFFPPEAGKILAAESLELTGEGSYNIYPYLEVLEDPQGVLGIEEILLPEFQEKFSPHGQGTPSYSYTDSVFWFKWDLTGSSSDRQWFLEAKYPLLQDVQFFYPGDKGEYNQVKTGSLLPFYERPIQNMNFVFPIPEVTQGETRTFYLRTQTDFAHIVPLKILERNYFYAQLSREYYAHGIYYGILLIMVFYNLFLLYFSRDIRFLFYILYIVCIAFFHLSLNGLSFQFLWSQSPEWANRSGLFFSFGGVFFLLLFACRVLELKKKAPFWERVFLGIAAFSFLMLPGTFVFSYTPTMQISIGTVLIGSIALLVGVVKSWQANNPPAVYLFLAWLFLVGGIFLLIGRSFGFLPHSFITFSGIQLGSTLEFIFLSLALVAHTSALDEEKEKALEMARRDDLTGLFNRRALFAIGQKQLEIARLQSSPLSIVMVDIDEFKQLNDQYGHEVGDNILRVFAERLKHRVRVSDCVARYGGDEFCFLLYLTNSSGAQERMEEIREELEEETLYREEDYNFKLTASFGIASYQGESEFKELINRADSALYTAKKEGGNRVVVLSREL